MLLWSILILLLSFIAVQSEIFNLTDNNFDTQILKNKKSKWIIIFYVDDCSYCHQVINMINNEVIKDYQSNDVLFGSVDCNKNIWTSSRFNITQIPHFILLFREKMYTLTGYVSKETLVKFIDEEKYVEQGSPIPKGTKGIEKFIQGFGFLLETMDLYAQEYIDKNNFNFKWRRIYTHILLLVALLIWVKIETFLIGLCFKIGRKPNNNKEGEKVNKEKKVKND